ncbi:hypothetical protein C7444_10416 [Sphaerotilus hippei]|uniref:Uncharacterized protein n=1 Tax=Sphaerotilus hippei TaxID=744406 RepID=A0A318H707_9BURK|nr:hypothetical protein [Sphaerotilus hippei]PXW97415.1 hypothetical protein C7444_10416 [Sphaerotilus hippei]
MSTTAAVLTWRAGRLTLSEGDGRTTILPLGPEVLADRHWPQRPPSPLQLERAIDEVETAIEQSGLVHAPRDRLRLAGPWSELMPQRLRHDGDIRRDEIESEFSKLVSAAHRGPGEPVEATHQGVHAAALLMLRELMHHLGFQWLTAAT